MDDWPNWHDAGRRVTIVTEETGESVTGWLDIAHVFNTGEDEVPVWDVVGDDGTRYSFAGASSWSWALAPERAGKAAGAKGGRDGDL